MTFNPTPVLYVSAAPSVEDIISSAAAQLVMEEAASRFGGHPSFVSAGERSAVMRAIGLDR